MNARLSFRMLVGTGLMVASVASLPAHNRAAVPAQDHAGQYEKTDIVYGLRLYTAQCAQCHGADGTAVGTVNLRSGQFRRAGTDQQLRQLITTGIQSAGMPAFKFDNGELIGLVA